MSPASYIWVGRGDEHSETNIEEMSLKRRKNHADPCRLCTESRNWVPPRSPEWLASLEDVALSEWLGFRGRLSCPPVGMTSNLQTKTPEEIRMNWQAAGIYLIIIRHIRGAAYTELHSTHASTFVMIVPQVLTPGPSLPRHHLRWWFRLVIRIRRH